VQADKRTLISKFELGIPIRDMRLLDSTLVTTSRGYIAVRENAIVFAIECAPDGVGGRVMVKVRTTVRIRGLGLKFRVRFPLLMALASEANVRPQLSVMTAPARQLRSNELRLTNAVCAAIGSSCIPADSLEQIMSKLRLLPACLCSHIMVQFYAQPFPDHD